MERAAAHMAHIFTVVSKVTAIEAQQLLKRKPDLLTPNGLKIKNHLKNERELLKQKKKSRTIIDEFVKRHLSYDEPIDSKTFYFFIAGRYEFCNKGADIFIEALARLNYLLQTQDPDVTVVAFFFFPTQTEGWNDQTLLRHTGKASSTSRKRTPQTADFTDDGPKNIPQTGSIDNIKSTKVLQTREDSLDGPKISGESKNLIAEEQTDVVETVNVGVDGWESI